MSRSIITALIVCFLADILCEEPDKILIVEKQNRSFVIDYDTDQFLLDGKPFRYVSGEIHYFRMPRIYWEDRLIKIRAAGLNAVQTYVEWSQHEPSPGVYTFSGDLDLVHFIKLAEKHDLLVILRPGPYICAERDLGGYPPWLFTLHPHIRLRTSDLAHKFYVNQWMNVLMTKIQPFLYGNGGPIIMVQVENEYGSYFACDFNYTIWLRDLFRSYIHNNAVLFTTDGAGDGFMRCGPIPGVFITVDFAPGTNVTKAFEVVRNAGQLNGPLVNSEYYTGWLTHWNEKFQEVPTQKFIETLKDILDYSNSTSVNLYMFYGGTNFGFMAGANCDDSNGYRPQLTSYDYDAPITEAGDLTSKYFAIKELLKQYLPVPDTFVNTYTKKGNYGEIKLEPKMSLFDISFDGIHNKFPLSFEDINQLHGFVLYKHKLHGQIADPSQLYVPGIRDRAIVFINQVPVGILSRFRNIFSIPLKAHSGDTLSLLVENEGHINYGTYINDTKGIVCQVLLNGKELIGWESIKIPLDNISDYENLQVKNNLSNFVMVPRFYTGTFQLPKDEKTAYDTYLNLDRWGKGVAFLNGFNLGRYWVNTGSQVTLYVPGNLFKSYPDFNNLTILELEHKNVNHSVLFQEHPIINSTVPILGRYNRICQIQCRPIM
ncbi:ectoderm-expressed 3 [Lycorma delicatula]|uniref:ectoderm-expressed 3 n=1 Tax=Lycorma delicatula TaxID=130591 RepID=UPI003F5164FB